MAATEPVQPIKMFLLCSIDNFSVVSSNHNLFELNFVDFRRISLRFLQLQALKVTVVKIFVTFVLS